MIENHIGFLCRQELFISSKTFSRNGEIIHSLARGNFEGCASENEESMSDEGNIITPVFVSLLGALIRGLIYVLGTSASAALRFVK